jgi:hypothetical protein
MIEKSHIDNLSALSESFQASRPFKHVVLENFFDIGAASSLIENFPYFERPELLLNEFGAPNPKKVISDVRSINECYRKLDDYIQSPSFLKVIERITGVTELVYDPDYVGAGTHENFSTAGLDPHYDFNILPKSKLHRRLNCIVYLNERWDDSWGGQLNLHRDAWDLDDQEIVSISPVFNRCIIFETNQRSWHSVTPVTIPSEEDVKSRKSFTIYLYTKTRPKEEEAPPHGTVYVQLPLPKEIQPNTVLTKWQYSEIRNNIQRRHSYLKVMYQKEYGLQNRIVRLENELKKWKSSVAIQVLGKAIVTEITEPINPDRWVGEHLSFRLRMFSDVKIIRLSGYRPAEWGHMELCISYNGEESRFDRKGGFEVIKPVDIEADAAGVDVDIVISAVGYAQTPEGDSRKLVFVLTGIEIQ